MKNVVGSLIGFVTGLAGFLYLFRIFFLVRTPPQDELAPGIVVMLAMMSGILFAFTGSLVQSKLVKK
jgi:hypothetical protein